MEYVYTSFVFLLSIVEAVLFYHVVCRRKLAVVTWKKLLPLPVLYLAMLFCVAFVERFIFQTVVIMALYYVAGIIFTQSGWIENIKYWILSFTLSSVAEQMVYQLVWDSYFESVDGYGLGNVLTSAVVSVILFVINKLSGSKDAGEVQYSKKILMILIPAACAVATGISYMGYSIEELDDGRAKRLTLFVLLAAMVGVCVIMVMIARILWQRERFRMKADMEKEYSRQQRDYFELLLEKEEETRRFRHDSFNHFICLLEHIKNQRYQTAETYLEDLLEKMEEIRGMQYETGNEVVNVLLNYYLIPVKETCSISIEGYLGKLDHISQMELCTIFSNVIKNAVEAVGTGSIKIRIVRKEKFAEVVIGNTFEKELSLSETGILQTGKEDKDNHGFGLENVQRVIRKNHGEFEYHADGNWFEVVIILPV